MPESQTPTTITRMFDPTVWGLRTNQLRIFFACAILTAFYAVISRVLIPGILVLDVVGALIVVASWMFFVFVGLNRVALYNFERRIIFLISRAQGEEQIRKYNKKDWYKVKLFSRIMNIFEGGYTQFWPVGKGNNWGIYLELFACKPDDLEVFFANSEMTLTGVPADTIIKTVLKARKNTGDSGAIFKKELKKGKQIPLLRDICYEQAAICDESDSKSYETHMGFIIPYTTKKEDAFLMLDNICVSVQKALKQNIGIESKRLETEEEILNMFAGMISHNTHIMRGIE